MPVFYQSRMRDEREIDSGAAKKATCRGPVVIAARDSCHDLSAFGRVAAG